VDVERLSPSLGALGYVRPRGGSEHVRFECGIRDLDVVHDDDVSVRLVNAVVVHGVVVGEIERSGRAWRARVARDGARQAFHISESVDKRGEVG
jgi:hypothetical protein